MKKALLILALVFMVSQVSAQGIPLEFGARMAMNGGKFNEGFPNWNAERQLKLGLITGLFATYFLHQSMALMAEMNYAQKGGKFKWSSTGYSSTYTYLMSYLTLNMFFQYYFIRNFALFAGPQF